MVKAIPEDLLQQNRSLCLIAGNEIDADALTSRA